MLINLIKYLMLLTAGIIIGYFLFSTEDNNKQSSESTLLIQATKQPLASPTSTPIRSVANGSPESQQSLEKQNEIIEAQRLEIAGLQEKLANLIIAPLKQTTTSEEHQVKGIETLTMKDFEDKMKSQFLDRFKGYAIELEGERLNDIKTQFNSETDKAEWNADYETKITSYIQENDPERIHYIDELTCNSNMCRLKVNSNQTASWQQLFLSMTQQSWYHSITLSENSGVPSVFIYYITQPRNI